LVAALPRCENLRPIKFMHLSAIGRLALLKEFYGKIIIPPTVWKEVVEEGMGRIEGTDVKQPDRIGG